MEGEWRARHVNVQVSGKASRGFCFVLYLCDTALGWSGRRKPAADLFERCAVGDHKNITRI